MGVFQTQFEKGSMLDRVSGAELTNTATTFKRSEKGLVADFNGSTSKLGMSSDPVGTGDVTIYDWIKPQGFGGGTAGRIANNGSFDHFVTVSGSRIGLKSDNVTTVLSTTNAIVLGKWTFVAMTRTSVGIVNIYIGYDGTPPALSGSADQDSGTPVAGTSNLFIGNREDGNRAFDGKIGRVYISDKIDTLDDINKEYKLFLKATNLSETKRNFYYPKPDDLSNEVQTTLGQELITNGDFATDTDWTKDTNSWIISNGKSTYGTLGYPTGVSSELKQVIDTPENSTVCLKYDIIENTLDAGSLLLEGGSFGIPSADLGIPSTVGQHTVIIETITYVLSQIDFTITGSPSSGVLSIDNVSVKELTGLVAAYNMIPSAGGVLTDISGNGNNGTINGALSTEDGMRFDGVDLIPLDSAINLGTTHSMSLRLTYAGTGESIVGLNSGNFAFFTQSSSVIRYRSQLSNADFSVPPMILGVTYNFTIIRDDVTVKLYVNGVQEGGDQTLSANFSLNIDRLTISGIEYTGIVKDLIIHNRTYTLQEVKDYHNQFAKQVYLKDYLEYDKADGTNIIPEGWTAGTGTVKGGEIAEGSQDLSVGVDKFFKYIEWTGNGTMKLLYNQSTEVDATIIEYSGGGWTRLEDTLTNLISGNAWLSLVGGYLVFDKLIGERIGLVVIRQGIKV